VVTAATFAEAKYFLSQLIFGASVEANAGQSSEKHKLPNNCTLLTIDLDAYRTPLSKLQDLKLDDLEATDDDGIFSDCVSRWLSRKRLKTTSTATAASSSVIVYGELVSDDDRGDYLDAETCASEKLRVRYDSLPCISYHFPFLTAENYRLITAKEVSHFRCGHPIFYIIRCPDDDQFPSRVQDILDEIIEIDC
jgi:hypothetical protein